MEYFIFAVRLTPHFATVQFLNRTTLGYAGQFWTIIYRVNYLIMLCFWQEEQHRFLVTSLFLAAFMSNIYFFVTTAQIKGKLILDGKIYDHSNHRKPGGTLCRRI
jgi:hypothetical protein